VDINVRWAHISLRSTSMFLGFSLFALLVMIFVRYLATSYPIFHRTSVTKGRLLTLLAQLLFPISIALCNIFHFFLSCNDIHQLQTVSSRQKKS
jgi:type II secretory pathway component PulM